MIEFSGCADCRTRRRRGATGSSQKPNGKVARNVRNSQDLGRYLQYLTRHVRCKLQVQLSVRSSGTVGGVKPECGAVL